MLDFEARLEYIDCMKLGAHILRFFILFLLLLGLFFVGTLSSFINGRTLYTEEELLAKLPSPSPWPANFPRNVSTKPEQFEHVFYSLKDSYYVELKRFELKPYSFNDAKNRIIDNAIYFTSGSQLLKFDLITKDSSIIFELGPDDAILDFSFNKTQNLFYFTTFKKELNADREIEQQLVRFNPVTQERLELTAFTPGIFKVIKHLFASADTDIIYTEGGETCGGGGSIFAVQNKNRTLIKEYGVGCADGSRLLGADSQFGALIMAESIERESDRTKADVKRVFRKSIGDGSEINLFSTYENGYTEQTLSDDQSKVILKSENKILVFDLKTGFQNEYFIEDELFQKGFLNVVSAEGDLCLIADDYEKKVFGVNCLIRNTTEIFDYGKLDLSSPQVFGYYDGHIIFSASKEKGN